MDLFILATSQIAMYVYTQEAETLLSTISA